MADQGSIGKRRFSRYTVRAVSAWPTAPSNTVLAPIKTRFRRYSVSNINVWPVSPNNVALAPIKSHLRRPYLRKQLLAQGGISDIFGAFFSPNNGSISGVTTENGVLVGNVVVRLYHKATGMLVDTTISSSVGTFNFIGYDQKTASAFFAVALDPVGGTNYNALLFDQLTPYFDNTGLGRGLTSVGRDTSLYGSQVVYQGYPYFWLPMQMAAGNTIFSYEFDNGYLDLSPNTYNGSAGGSGTTFTADDPAPSGGNSANFNGSGFVSLPSAAGVAGNASRTLIAVVNMSSGSFVSGSSLIYMGGGDNASSGAFMSFGLGCVGSAASPALRLDWTRDVNDVGISTGYIGAWATLVLTHDGPTHTQKLYGSIAGSGSYTLLMTSTRTLNTVMNGATFYVGNWIAQWNGIRRYQGKIAYLGMKDTVMTPTELARFLIP